MCKLSSCKPRLGPADFAFDVAGCVTTRVTTGVHQTTGAWLPRHPLACEGIDARALHVLGAWPPCLARPSRVPCRAGPGRNCRGCANNQCRQSTEREMQGEGGDSSFHAGREKEPREPPPPSHPDTHTFCCVCICVRSVSEKGHLWSYHERRF